MLDGSIVVELRESLIVRWAHKWVRALIINCPTCGSINLLDYVPKQRGVLVPFVGLDHHEVGALTTEQQVVGIACGLLSDPAAARVVFVTLSVDSFRDLGALQDKSCRLLGILGTI